MRVLFPLETLLGESFIVMFRSSCLLALRPVTLSGSARETAEAMALRRVRQEDATITFAGHLLRSRATICPCVLDPVLLPALRLGLLLWRRRCPLLRCSEVRVQDCIDKAYVAHSRRVRQSRPTVHVLQLQRRTVF